MCSRITAAMYAMMMVMSTGGRTPLSNAMAQREPTSRKNPANTTAKILALRSFRACCSKLLKSEIHSSPLRTHSRRAAGSVNLSIYSVSTGFAMGAFSGVRGLGETLWPQWGQAYTEPSGSSAPTKNRRSQSGQIAPASVSSAGGS